jgi:molecular chaperone DnaK
VDGIFSPIIPRNSTIPVSRTEIYSTTADGQTQVDVKVFQGEDRLVKNDVFLDQYRVDGVPPGPAGSERVAVTFTYDVNGILHVRTKVVSTGKEALLRVHRSAQRMTPPERAAAKARIDEEWKGEGRGAAAPAASPPSRSPASDSETAELRDLARAARARHEGAPPAVSDRLAALAADLDLALDRGDAARASAVSAELTDVLFDLG